MVKMHLQICASYSQLSKHENALTNAGEATKECHELFIYTKNICNQYKENAKNKDNPQLNILDGYISTFEAILDDILNRISDVKELFQSLTDEKIIISKSQGIMTKAKINDMKRDKTYKISKRNILGVKPKVDWVEDTNIGNIMRITPLKAEDFNTLRDNYSEINQDTLIEKVILLGICYFSLSTELRLLDESLSKYNVASERIHSKAVEITCLYLPLSCPLVEHVSSSYLKYHSPIVAIERGR